MIAWLLTRSSSFRRQLAAEDLGQDDNKKIWRPHDITNHINLEEIMSDCVLHSHAIEKSQDLSEVFLTILFSKKLQNYVIDKAATIH